MRVTGRPPRAPAWARAIDVAVLVLCAASLFVSAAGRTLLVKYGQVVLPPPAQLLFAAAGVLVVRHVARPRPGMLSTLKDWRDRLAARPHADAAVRAFVFTRPMV